MTVSAETPPPVPNTEIKLSPKEVAEQAQKLIRDFSRAIRHIPGFQAETARLFFGKTTGGLVVDPEDGKRVSFEWGRITWGLRFEYTRSSESMMLTRTSSERLGYGVVQKYDLIELRAGREQRGKPEAKKPPRIFYCQPGDYREGIQPVSSENTQLAVEKAQEFLAALKG